MKGVNLLKNKESWNLKGDGIGENSENAVADIFQRERLVAKLQRRSEAPGNKIHSNRALVVFIFEVKLLSCMIIVFSV